MRAILIHFGEQLSLTGVTEDLILNLIGNGTPVDSSLLSSDSWNQTYLYRGIIDYRNICRIPFYVPAQLVDREGRNKVHIKYTVAYSPETARTLKSGYCKSNMRAKLCKIGPDGQLKEVTADDTQTRISDRYSTINRGEKVFSRAVAAGDWALLVEHQSRWKLESNELPFAAIITVCDPTKSPGIDIFQAIRNEVPGKYLNELIVRERIRV